MAVSGSSMTLARPSILPELFASLPEAFAASFDPDAPWALLGEPLDDVLARLPSSAIAVRLLPEVHLAGDRIVIGRGARIHPGVVLEGPLSIGEDVEIRPGAYIRGGVWIGDGCVVGASTEIKRAILLPGAKAPHLNYVGDSILGSGVNLGAGTILSNFRHDGREVRIGSAGAIPSTAGAMAAAGATAPAAAIPSGRRKLGAVLGDGVLTGCNCVLHPGVVVGRETHLYPGVQLRSGIYPARSVVKLRQDLEVAARAERPPGSSA
jgi:acetyltransferase-like isoleucine patch superfamily enzyme